MTDHRFDAVLIYDGECPFCSAAAGALRRLPAVGVVAWSDNPAQEVLQAQFGDVPFALALVDRAEERVYAGRDAAVELCERSGLPGLIQAVMSDHYESLARGVRTLTGTDGDPDPFHGTYDLTPDARSLFEGLDAAAESTRRRAR